MKKQREVKDFIILAARLRLAQLVLLEAINEYCVVVNKEGDKMWRVLRWVNRAISNGDSFMFNTHPELSNYYLKVFYSAKDEKIVEIAKSAIEEAESNLLEFFEGHE